MPHTSLIVLLFSLPVLFLSCKQSRQDGFFPEKSDSVVDTLDPNTHGDHTHNIGRAIWQKPGLVIDKLGDVSEKTVVDIGAGTGYFSFRLAKKAKKVIAVDIEQGMLAYIDSVKQNLDLGPAHQIETRLANRTDPNIMQDEADVVVIINTVAYIPQLPAYLQTLKKGLKPNGMLMVIDYKMKRLPINAPPKSERIYLDKLEDMLIENGYQVVETDDTSLDYQYILQARNIE